MFNALQPNFAWSVPENDVGTINVEPGGTAYVLPGATATVLKTETTDTGSIIRLSNIVGTFSATEQITGGTSGTTANLGATATEHAGDKTANNQTIQTVADGIIDFSEGNPFSEGSF